MKSGIEKNLSIAKEIYKDNKNKVLGEKLKRILKEEVDIIETRLNKKFENMYFNLDKKMRTTINTIAIFSFLISLTINLLVNLINSSSPFVYLMANNKEFLAWGYLFLTTIGLSIFCYFAFMSLLRNVIKFWKS